MPIRTLDFFFGRGFEGEPLGLSMVGAVSRRSASAAWWHVLFSETGFGIELLGSASGSDEESLRIVIGSGNAAVAWADDERNSGSVRAARPRRVFRGTPRRTASTTRTGVCEWGWGRGATRRVEG